VVGFFDARFTTPTAEAGLIDGPLANNLGNPDNRVIAPGSVEHSILLKRLGIRGQDQMPPIASTIPDPEGVSLLTAWITNELPFVQKFEDWQSFWWGAPDVPSAARDADPDFDGANNYAEYLTDTIPVLDLDVWGIGIQRVGDAVRIIFPRIANRGFEVQWTVDPTDPTSWAPLNVPGNEPVFSARNEPGIVEDLVTDAQQRFYRVRVFAP
jgi:hypothetical protein